MKNVPLHIKSLSKPHAWESDSVLRPAMNLLQRFRPTTRSVAAPQIVAPRRSPTTGFITIPASEKVEEENWAWYTPHSFYPVHIGDVLHSKYQVLYKLGYGMTATIWMCRDLQLVSSSFSLFI